MAPTYVMGENRTEAPYRTLMANATLPSVENPGRKARLSFGSFLGQSLCFYMHNPNVVGHLRERRETDPSDSLPSEEAILEFLENVKGQEKKYNSDGIYSTSLGRTGFSLVVQNYYAGRCLFRTKKGLLGLGPYSVQKGDQVWVVPSGRTPYILGPLWDTSSSK